MPRELALLIFQTADGVMQAPRLPDPDATDRCGDWATPYWEPVMAQVARVAMNEPYDVLLGRRTYELFAAGFADAPPDHPLNRATKHVATSAPQALAWAGARPLGADVPAAVARLKREAGPLLQVHGSWQLVQTLLAHDLVDELRLWTFPVVAGAGKRLFAGGYAVPALQLTALERTPCGVVMTLYRTLRNASA